MNALFTSPIENPKLSEMSRNRLTRKSREKDEHGETEPNSLMNQVESLRSFQDLKSLERSVVQNHRCY